MVALGVVVAARLLGGRPPLTTSALLDGVFAAFFIARGALNVHAARRASRRRHAGDVGGTGTGPA